MMQFLEGRIKELDALIVDQSQHLTRMSNNLLMLQGAKQELNFLLENELKKELCPVKLDDCVSEDGA